MKQFITSRKLEIKLSHLEQCDLAYISSLPNYGKTSLVKYWIQKKRKNFLYIDFATQEITSSSFKKNSDVFTEKESLKKFIASFLNSSLPKKRIGTESTSIPSNQHFIVLDQLSETQDTKILYELSQIISQYINRCKFILISREKPHPCFLETLFKNDSLIVDQNDLKIDYGSFLSFASHIGTTADLETLEYIYSACENTGYKIIQTLKNYDSNIVHESNITSHSTLNTEISKKSPLFFLKKKQWTKLLHYLCQHLFSNNFNQIVENISLKGILTIPEDFLYQNRFLIQRLFFISINYHDYENNKKLSRLLSNPSNFSEQDQSILSKKYHTQEDSIGISASSSKLSQMALYHYFPNKNKHKKPPFLMLENTGWNVLNSSLMLTYINLSINDQNRNLLISLFEKMLQKSMLEEDVYSLLQAFKLLSSLYYRNGNYEFYIKILKKIKKWSFGKKIQDCFILDLIELFHLPFSGTKTVTQHHSNLFKRLSNFILKTKDCSIKFIYYQNLSLMYLSIKKEKLSLYVMQKSDKLLKKIDKPFRFFLEPCKIAKIRFELSEEYKYKKNDEDNLSAIKTTENNMITPIKYLLLSILKHKNSEHVHAEVMLTDAISQAKKLGLRGDLISIYLFAIYFYHARGNKELSLDYYIQITNITNNVNCVLAYYKTDFSITPTLELAIKKKVAPKFAKELIQLKKQENDFKSDSLILKLSKREKEILELMNEGKSNEQISIELCRSLGTIKLHTHNIYKKLNVKNRVEAINILKSV